MSRAKHAPPPAFGQRSPSLAAARPEPAMHTGATNTQPRTATTQQAAVAPNAAINANRPEYPAPSGAIEPQVRGGSRRPVLYGFAGFFLGVAFWHAVGFWSFVSEAVFSGPRTQEVRATNDNRFAASPNAFTAGSPIETGSIGNAASGGNGAQRAVPATASKHDRRLDGSAATEPAAQAAAQAGACTTVALNAGGAAQLQPGCPSGTGAGSASAAPQAAPASSWSAEIERNRIDSIR